VREVVFIREERGQSHAGGGLASEFKTGFSLWNGGGFLFLFLVIFIPLSLRLMKTKMKMMRKRY